jgi:hypothetical protein
MELGEDNQQSNFRLIATPEVMEEALTNTLLSITNNADSFIEVPLSPSVEPLLE